MRSDNFLILLVEDEQADAHLIRMAMKEAGLAIDLVHVLDGVEALEYLQQVDEGDIQKRPDLILLDLNMPRMNGLEFLRRVKAHERYRVLPVVIMTTSDSDTDVSAAYSEGAAGFVVKPMDVSTFIDQIRQLQSYWFDLVRHPNRMPLEE